MSAPQPGLQRLPASGMRLGIELEMPVAARADGASHCVGERYFERLLEIKAARGQAAALARADDGRPLAVAGAHGESGLDNGYNLLEAALAPVAGGPARVTRLATLAHAELDDVARALVAEDAVVLNVSEHPDCPIDSRWYAQACVPRPIYRELAGHRGWHHWVGLDAKAQHGANTEVPTARAAQALNAALALAPALIALFANSPLEGGRPTGLKENRLSIWPRMFAPARFAGDLALSRLPARPFADLGDYFRWMFGPGTASRSLPLSRRHDYKRAPTVLLDGDPCLAQFLQARAWAGVRIDNGERVTLAPGSAHFEYSQIAQFLDARWRYRLDELPPLGDLMQAWQRDGGLEELFERCGAQGYIEGRAPGACFADRQLLDEAGASVARTAALSASAVQAGLLANLDEAGTLVRDWGWGRLAGLREAAVRDALADDQVHALARDVLAVARAGLDADDRQWLAYAEYVLATRRTGADRLLELWQGVAGGDPDARLRAVCAARAMVAPAELGGG